MKRFLVAFGLVLLGVALILCLPTDSGHPRSARRAPVEPIAQPEPQPVPPESTTAPVASPIESRQSFRFEEFDGRPVGELAVRFRRADQTVDLETDEAGAVDVACKGRGKIGIEMLDPTWSLTKSEFAEAIGPTTVVVYREVQLDGVVKVVEDGFLDLTTVNVGFSIGAARKEDGDGAARLQRLIRQGIPHEARIANASADGTFQGTLPRVDGFVVHATAPGWFAESVPVLLDADAERVSVVLELRRGVRLYGRLLDDSGRPVPKGTLVHIFITVRGDPKTLPVEEAYRLRGSARCGMTFILSEKRGESIASFRYQVMTDAEGRYSAIAQQQGDVIVRAYVPGHIPATTSGGWVQAQGHELGLVARRVEAPTSVEIKLEGVIQPNTPVRVVDLVPRGPHITLVTRTDAEGKLPSSWFESGRDYMLMVGEPPNHVGNRKYIHWNGESSINVIPKGKKGHEGLPKDWW
ncbi:MAG: hypothetical protein ACYS0F_12355 [Planctomycetota bacterium]|jgi:hypothetical protein